MAQGKEDFSEDSQSTYEEEVRGATMPDHPHTLAAMMKIAADIKCTFLSAITELKVDILSLSEKLEGVEKAGSRWDRATSYQPHLAHLIEMNRQLEDLDNRGRRHNIRVRGIPETVEQSSISSVLQSVFNNLLECQTDT